MVTPDHTIRTKNWPLVLAGARGRQARTSSPRGARSRGGHSSTHYRDYFARNNARAGGGKQELDPLPRVVLVPGLGLFGLGRTKQDARIAADIAEAVDRGRRRCRSHRPLRVDLRSRHVRLRILAAGTGQARRPQGAAARRARSPPSPAPAGAIGAATAKAFAAAGAEVALLDVDLAAAREQAKAIGGDGAARSHCDVTDAASVQRRLRRASRTTFGGVDIVVSNAGAAWQGRIGEVDEAMLRKSFELNFYGHQRVAQAAVKIMLAQGTGGCLLFNVSKQAVNPGPNFGPYGLPKAALLALMRQYALDYGADGIRANAVNADRIRSGLLTARDDRRALQGARPEREGLHERQSARPRSHRRGRGAGLPASGAGAEDHRRRHHGRRRQYRGGDAVRISARGYCAA